jgi:hypothetical protein
MVYNFVNMMFIKKFQVVGIILIDCWGKQWLDQFPAYSQFYSKLEQFILDNVDYQYIVSSSEDLADNLKALPGTHILCQNWEDLELYFDSPSVAGNWLIGGHAWDICVHHSNIGLLSLMKKKYLNFLMFSHPNLISLENLLIKVTDDQFRYDSKISWTKQWTLLDTEYWTMKKFLNQ